jgi:TatD DNase family protein
MAMTSPFKLIDTHMHLHTAQFDGDRQATFERAIAAGVARMIEIGYDIESSHAAVRLAETDPRIFAAVGIQPHYAAVADRTWIAEIGKLAEHPRVVAIGEIGLDYFHDRAPHDLQASLFREQLALARGLQLPVVIHSRDAHDDTVRMLQASAQGQPGIMHSFSGDWAYAQACLDVGFHLSFSGPVTFAKATELHDVARRAPLDRVLCETDCPYLAPHPLRGKRNEPANVRLVAEQLARLREQPLEDLAAAIWRNACDIFRLNTTD